MVGQTVAALLTASTPTLPAIQATRPGKFDPPAFSGPLHRCCARRSCSPDGATPLPDWSDAARTLSMTNVARALSTRPQYPRRRTAPSAALLLPPTSCLLPLGNREEGADR